MKYTSKGVQVVQQLRKGYKLRDRLLRPASVVVIFLLRVGSREAA